MTDLTLEDRYILERAAEGASNEEIAAEMHFHRSAVVRRLTRLFRYLGVPNRVAAVAWFVRFYG